MVAHVIAHRGASRLAKENTIEAFRAAVRVGAAGIELDARRTSDGVLVVHHDPLVDGRAIISIAATELPEWVPTLSAALDACVGAFVNIEIKNSPEEPDFDPDEA
ncbi:MAG: glycerophosphodiester phosphodiesterase, partial [Actinomycetota bacterium]|nr:glycerophosphodiester phosphodiesterase [Actinomycetota bacterium]